MMASRRATAAMALRSSRLLSPRVLAVAPNPQHLLKANSQQQKRHFAPRKSQAEKWAAKEAKANSGDKERKMAQRKQKREKLVKRKQKAEGIVVDDDDEVQEKHDHDHDYDHDHDHDDTDPTLPNVPQIKEKMLTVVARLEETFKSIRGADPSPEIFDLIQVSAYGATTPLASVAQVIIVSPTLATATCFDPALSQDVLNAIRDTLELNPSLEDDDGVVKIPLPRMSMESRKKSVQILQRKSEHSKTKIRNVRRKAMDFCKKAQNGKMEGISKDDAFRVGKDVEAVTEELVAMVDKVCQEKEAQVLAS